MKTYIKFIIGIIALAAIAMGLFATLAKSNLENKDLRHWAGASESEKNTAVLLLSAGDSAHVEILSQCISRMAGLPDSGTVKIRDAAGLCAIGVALNENK
ncbi:MAG: hypothetical protein LBO08_01955 [Rickettsiales bacterium]|jgi:glucose uptake protein GlcU|nr:hypothetical protein [Rickettsiales bacterium]